MSRFDETIKKMQDITSDIKEKADLRIMDLDEDTGNKIKTVADKTIDVINEAAFKLKETVDKIEDEEGLNEFLNRVEAKCEGARKYTYEKFDEIVKASVPASETPRPKMQGKSTMEKFMDNENVRSASRLVKNLKGNLIDFYRDPNTQLRINEAKLAALNIADKGLDILKKTVEKTKERKNKE